MKVSKHSSAAGISSGGSTARQVCRFGTGIGKTALTSGALGMAVAGVALTAVFPAVSHGAIAIDNSLVTLAPNPSAAFTTNTSTTDSLTYTVSPCATVLVVQLGFAADSYASTPVVTWNATPLTSFFKVSSASTNIVAGVFYLFNPTPGTFTISTTNTIRESSMAAFTLSGVNTSGIVTSGSHDTPGSPATTSTVGLSGLTSGDWAVFTTGNRTVSTQFVPGTGTITPTDSVSGNTVTKQWLGIDSSPFAAQTGGYDIIGGSNTTANITNTIATNNGNDGGTTRNEIAAVVFAPLLPSVWTGTTSSDWGVSTNWSGNPAPNASGVGVTFGNNTSGSTTTNLTSASETVGTITFAGTSSATVSASSTNKLTLDNLAGTGGSLITVNGGTNVISAPLVLNNTALGITATSGSLNISGGISSAGNQTLTVNAGGGNLILSSADSSTGLTTIASRLTVATGASFAGNVSVTSGGVLDLGTTMTSTTALTLNGIGISSGGALTNSSSTAGTYAGLIALGSASSIVASSGNVILSNTGTITGSGLGLTLGGAGTGSSIASIIGTTTGTLTKQDAGTWTLSGTNTYTGGTTISAGTLAATNASALGTGAVINNGTLNIGNGSALNLNLSSGTYTQGSGGKLTLQVNSSSSFSSLQTSGTASLNGTLNINVTGTPTADGPNFTVLNTGTRSGTFSGYTTNIPNGLAIDTSRVEKTGQLSIVNYFNGFENVNGAWANNAGTFSNNATSYVIGGTTSTPPGNAQQMVDAANASSNAAYGKLTTSALATVGGVFPATANVGPLTRFNGNNSSVNVGPSAGFSTQADVYIDPSWAGDSNGTGFDYSSAVSTKAGAFQRDFIFHVFKSGGTMYLAGSNNSDYMADPNNSQITNKIAITSAGWYTLQDVFRDNGSGVLAVDLNAYNSSGTNIYTQTVSSSLDTTGTSGIIGGNNYAWFVNIDTGSNGNSLNVDNVKLLNTTGGGVAAPLALTSGTLLLNNTTLSNTTEDIGGTTPGAVTNGYDYTSLVSGMTADLSGDLSIDLVDGFANQITPSEQFTILQASDIQGTYSNVNNGSRVETADGSGSFLANYETTGGQQSLVLSDFQAGSVPEPGMIVLIAAGTMALLPRYRRRK